MVITSNNRVMSLPTVAGTAGKQRVPRPRSASRQNAGDNGRRPTTPNLLAPLTFAIAVAWFRHENYRLPPSCAPCSDDSRFHPPHLVILALCKSWLRLTTHHTNDSGFIFSNATACGPVEIPYCAGITKAIDFIKPGNTFYRKGS